MNKHPANNGKVMLMAWVDAPLRDYVRARAMEAKQQVSEWVGNALMRAVQATSLGAFSFPRGGGWVQCTSITNDCLGGCRTAEEHSLYVVRGGA